MPPYFQPATLGITGTIDVNLFEAGAAPSTIIRVGTPAVARVNWSISGGMVPLIDGDFKVRVAIEGFGSAPEPVLGPLNVDVLSVPLVGQTRTYLTDLNIMPLPEGAYTLIVLITYVTPGGAPGPIAALSEPIIFQVFP